MSRRWVSAGVAVAVVVGTVIVGAIALHRGETQPRFLASVTPIDVTTEECLAMVRTSSYGFGDSLAKTQCGKAEHGAWFDVTVQNVGDQEGFLKTCMVVGLDGDGLQVFKAAISFFPIQWPPGPPVNAGTSRTLRWYGLVVDPIIPSDKPLKVYRIVCPAVEYDGARPRVGDFASQRRQCSGSNWSAASPRQGRDQVLTLEDASGEGRMQMCGSAMGVTAGGGYYRGPTESEGGQCRARVHCPMPSCGCLVRSPSGIWNLLPAYWSGVSPERSRLP
jgi:hypothetical protein